MADNDEHGRVEGDEKAVPPPGDPVPNSTIGDTATEQEDGGDEEDSVAEALELLGETDIEEVEMMNQQGLLDDSHTLASGAISPRDDTIGTSISAGLDDHLPDREIAEALEASFRQTDSYGSSSFSKGPSSAIPFLRLLHETAERKRDAFFALYFGMPQGRVVEAPPKNPNTTHEVTFGELWDSAGVVAYNLKHTWNISKGQRVVLCYNYGPSGLAALLGCWRAGVAALIAQVPTCKPYNNILTELNQRVEQCHPIAMVLTDKKTFKKRNTDMANPFSSCRNLWLGAVPWRATDSLKHNPALHYLKAAAGAETSPTPYYTFDEANLSTQDLALIQYTSGSTGDPRPVLVNFASLQACLDMTQRLFQIEVVTTDQGAQMAEVTGMSPLESLPSEGALWGLVHATILPMMNGWRMYYMSPEQFAREPLLWLERISQNKIMWTLARDPDYPRVMDAFLAAKEHAKGMCPISYLDLSCMRHFQVLGQPLLAETHSVVTNALGEYGLCESWYTASYGLAEHVAGALFMPQDFFTCELQGDAAFPATKRVAVANRKSLDASLIVKVVDPITCQEVPDGQEGELWISSPAVASGYCKNSGLTRKVFGSSMETGSSERFLRTNDAAFFQNDYLFICGSLTDIIAVGDRALYPQDIEWVVEAASNDVIPGCVAAIEAEDNFNLEIVFEVFSDHRQDPQHVCKIISKAVQQRFGITPYYVIAIREDDIPRSAMGKIRRYETRKRLRADELDVMVEYCDIQKDNPVEKDTVEYLQRAKDLDQVFLRYFGGEFDENKSWDDLGLTPDSSIDLRYDMASHSSAYLTSSCFEEYSSPVSLKEHILESRGQPLPTNLPNLQPDSSYKMSWLFMGVLQAILSVVILLLFCAPIIPIYFVVGYLVADNVALSIAPIFMGSYSLLVLVMKWLVVGKYKAGTIMVPSFAYLRWWFIDRLLDTWEFWVGRFLVNTPFLNMFYICLGANISLSAKLDGFCREFDLITIRPYGCLNHRSLRARRFSSWKRFQVGPVMTLRPIEVGSKSHVRGMLSPGVTLGDHVFVEKLAVVPEGAQISDGMYVAGNPAVVTGKAPSSMKYENWLAVGFFKFKWLLLEFYIFSVLALSTEWFVDFVLAGQYFSMWVIWWALFIPTFSFLSLSSSIIVKWILLGRRKPGKFKANFFTEVLEWAADYHFFLSTLAFQTFSLNSRICNVILMLHGMDIDLASKVYFDSFPPSKMDLIHIRKSFVAGVSFDVKKYGALYPTYIQECSIGELAHVDAGLSLHQAVIAPVTVVSARTHVSKQGSFYPPPVFSIQRETAVIVVYGLVIVCFKASVYAGYLYWHYFASYSIPGWSYIFVLAGSLGIQSTLWMAVILLLQFVTFLGASEARPAPWSPSLYAVYLSSSASFQTWSMIPIFWGTQLFNDIARLFGTYVEGRFLYFGNRMYDSPFLSISSRTVSDGSELCSHNILYEQVSLGPTRLAGILHEGSLVMAGAKITSKESGPWRPIVRRSTNKPNYLSVSQDLEAPLTAFV